MGYDLKGMTGQEGAFCGSVGANQIRETLQRYRFQSTDEKELQTGIELALKDAGIPYQREHRLSGENRIDFLVGTVGVEVKIDGSLSALTRQLHRYAQVEDISALLVVTSRQRLSNLPSTMNAKPLAVLALLQGLV